MGSDEQSSKPTGLRRRLGVLEKAHSLSSHSSLDDPKNKQKAAPASMEQHHAEEASGQSHSSFTDYETYSESSESEDSPDGARTPVPEQPRRAAPSRSNSFRTDPPPYTSASKDRSWYEFDLAVVAALVMPVGNWLTGGEHIKNLLVIMLILFYLHQVIEVPWSLYQKSRQRQPPSSSIPSSSNSKELRYHSKASSELRFYEFLFLMLASASPFIGAYTLRYLSVTLTDTDILTSWFNIALFVVTTGIRPWTHLIQRLNRRITDLHDVVHYPTPESSSETADAMRIELADMKSKIQTLQKALADLNSKLVRDTDEIYDYVDDAVEMVEKSAKKHERKCEKQEGRVKELEVSLETMKKMRRPRPHSLSFPENPPRSSSSFSLPPKLSSAMATISSVLPPWLPLASLLPTPPSSSPTSPPQYEPKHSPSATVTRYSILSLSSPDGLATIPEENYQSQLNSPSSASTSTASTPSSSSGSSTVHANGRNSSGNMSSKTPNGISTTTALVSTTGGTSSPTRRNPNRTSQNASSSSSSRSPSPPSPSSDRHSSSRSSSRASSHRQDAKLGLFQRLLASNKTVTFTHRACRKMQNPQLLEYRSKIVYPEGRAMGMVTMSFLVTTFFDHANGFRAEVFIRGEHWTYEKNVWRRTGAGRVPVIRCVRET
ncbi:hypothetical protein K435DRAFT_811023 [Dendrothele bispora CBS 962.96]|uniref:Uncharacterized protein n=1 Tax=Dendrothele bispora (strain CBS 962.96) TaxID=1314807 RepID=A0A4S8KTI9_DENBC|nr:hypothetical protein K435DRAFT_811023 [Dendrothele bispora CBS 962.96]